MKKGFYKILLIMSLFWQVILPTTMNAATDWEMVDVDTVLTFPIARGGEHLTGSLTFTNGYISSPSYTVLDGDMETTYLFHQKEGGGTSHFALFDSESNVLNTRAYSAADVYKKELGNGDVELQAREVFTINGVDVEVSVTLTSSATGTVRHAIDMKNISTTAATLGGIQRIDTMLNTKDYVPIYSLGTGRGVYIDNRDDSRRVYFNRVPSTEGGYDNYNVGRFSFNTPADWVTSFFNADFAGSGIENEVSTVGDVLLGSVDTSVYFKWNAAPLNPNETRKMVYDVGLGEDTPIKAPILTVESSVVVAGITGENGVATLPYSWIDYDSATVSYQYQIDNGAWTSLEELTNIDVVNNDTANIPTTGLAIGNYTLNVQIVDPDGLTSNVVTLPLHIVEETLVEEESNTPPAEEESNAPPTEEALNFKIVYDGNGHDGGTIPVDNNLYQFGDIIVIAAGEPTKTGYVFGGWSDGTQVLHAGEEVILVDEATSSAYTASTGTPYTATENIIPLTAVWNQETVTMLPETGQTNNLILSIGTIMIGIGLIASRKLNKTK